MYSVLFLCSLQFDQADAGDGNNRRNLGFSLLVLLVVVLILVGSYFVILFLLQLLPY